MILQDLIPPPTDPEHAPTKAPINSKKDIEKGHSDESPIEKPVVETIDTVWKDSSLNDGVDSPLANALIINAIKNINKRKNTKNFNSGSKTYLSGFFLYKAK